MKAKNIKIIIVIVLVIFLTSGISVYAAYLYFARDVLYTKPDGTETSVKAALDELYNRRKIVLTKSNSNNYVTWASDKKSLTLNGTNVYVGTIDTSSAYNAGYSVGFAAGQKNGTGEGEYTLTYTIVHHHTGSSQGGGGCYGSAITGTRYVEKVYTGYYGWNTKLETMSTSPNEGGWHDVVRHYSWTCPYCGKKFGNEEVEHWGAGTGPASHRETAVCKHNIPETYIDHYEMNCGHNEGDFIRTSKTGNDLAANEKISKVEITFNQ